MRIAEISKCKLLSGQVTKKITLFWVLNQAEFKLKECEDAALNIFLSSTQLLTATAQF